MGDSLLVSTIVNDTKLNGTVGFVILLADFSSGRVFPEDIISL